MLIRLRKRDKNIAQATLGLFLGTWLLLLCQSCFAHFESNEPSQLSKSDIELPCHSNDIKPEPPTKSQHELIEEHCLGACDCDAVTASLNSLDKSENAKEFKKLTVDKVLLISSAVLHNKTNYHYPFSSPPEKAILLPYKRYTVLLN